MTTHSSTLAWKIPQTEEPGGIQPMGLQKVSQMRLSTQAHTHLEIKMPSLVSLIKLQSIFFIVSRNNQH